MYRVIRRNRHVFLNRDLGDRMLRIVCAHELGHDQLHRKLAQANSLHEFTLYDMTARPGSSWFLLSAPGLRLACAIRGVLRSKGFAARPSYFRSKDKTRREKRVCRSWKHGEARPPQSGAAMPAVCSSPHGGGFLCKKPKISTRFIHIPIIFRNKFRICP